MRSRKVSILQGVGFHTRLAGEWARNWNREHAWFIESHTLDEFDTRTLEEMPELKSKLDVPLTHDEVTKILDRVNRRASQLRTVAKRAEKT